VILRRPVVYLAGESAGSHLQVLHFQCPYFINTTARSFIARAKKQPAFFAYGQPLSNSLPFGLDLKMNSTSAIERLRRESNPQHRDWVNLQLPINSQIPRLCRLGYAPCFHCWKMKNMSIQIIFPGMLVKVLDTCILAHARAVWPTRRLS
jgi:hypothetical protein